ncbi:MAG TPA: transcription antitermination factor NusB [Propionicimonas sp.]|nr:transcription antitermination factor NusB [Propionicimonas sp.]
MSPRQRRADPARSTAFRIVRAVTGTGAYANLELARQRSALATQDAAFVTELVAGTCRAMGTYDQIIVAASGRPLGSLQPAAVDLLRLGTHQLLGMRVPAHAAISATVDVAAREVGERLVGLINAVLRKVAARDWEGWVEFLGAEEDELGRLSLAHHHPRWVTEAFADLLSRGELEELLAVDNIPATATLAVRPGLAEVDDLGITAARYSPYGGYTAGDPSAVPGVAQGRVGVQDEGSQLVTLALARAEAPAGLWLDLCAGPGGKTALLTGLADQAGASVLAAELHPHRAALVAANVRAYPAAKRPLVIAADGTKPPWAPQSFSKVLADVPCTGLGALRRRPESRWRRQSSDLPELVSLQRALLSSAITSTRPGGVIAYVTCSPHRAETIEVVEGAGAEVDVLHAADYLPEVPDAALGDFVQLWPQRHNTDAMFLALLRRR